MVKPLLLVGLECLLRLMNGWIDLVIQKLIEWILPFSLGLLLRKKVARFIVISKKRLFNDIITMNLFSVRLYELGEVTEFTHNIYEDIRPKIPNIKLLDLFSNGMRVSIPIFGNIRIFMEQNFTDEDIGYAEKGTVESIKITITPEGPLRLGLRELSELDDLAQFIEIIFSAIEKYCVKKSKIIQSYTVIESPRIKQFLEEKTFEFEDSTLGVAIHATPSKITLVITSSVMIRKSVQKYLLL